MLWNSLLLALRSIRRNLLRSFLTVLGVVIGVSAVVTMVTLGQGATASVRSQIAGLGSNLLQIRPGQRMGPGSDIGVPSFTAADATAIEAQIAGLRAVAPEVRASATVVQGARNWSTSLIGTTNAHFDTSNWTLASGRRFEDHEERAGCRGVRHRRDRAARAVRRHRSAGPAAAREAASPARWWACSPPRARRRWAWTRTTWSCCRCARCSAA